MPRRARIDAKSKLSEPPMCNTNLIAPCGIYCGSCRHYLARTEGVLEQKGLKHGCEGCRIRNKNCAFIKRDCPALRKKEVDFCFECKDFPCANLKALDNRYTSRHKVSLIENLRRIEKIGADKWLEEQKVFFTCPKCCGKISVHDYECYNCGNKIST